MSAVIHLHSSSVQHDDEPAAPYAVLVSEELQPSKSINKYPTPKRKVCLSVCCLAFLGVAITLAIIAVSWTDPEIELNRLPIRGLILDPLTMAMTVFVDLDVRNDNNVAAQVRRGYVEAFYIPLSGDAIDFDAPDVTGTILDLPVDVPSNGVAMISARIDTGPGTSMPLDMLRECATFCNHLTRAACEADTLPGRNVEELEGTCVWYTTSPITGLPIVGQCTAPLSMHIRILDLTLASGWTLGIGVPLPPLDFPVTIGDCMGGAPPPSRE